MNSYTKTALAAAICTALSAGNAGAATFNVTNTDDDGAGSLRDALTQAGTNAEADIIDLSTVSGQTISLTSGQLEIGSDDVTINGAGATLDAGGNSRVLATYYSDVTLNDLTITGGDGDGGSMVPGRGFGPAGAGGGIYAIETDLEVNDSEISGNSGAVGGGLFFYSDYGSLSVNDSVLSGNDALYAGGGVYGDTRFGDITFSGTEVSSNSAAAAGGGINLFSFGGNVVLVDSIVSNNAMTGSRPTARALTDRRAEFEAAREARQDGSSPWATRGDVTGGPSGYAGAGGAEIYSVYGDLEIVRSTISGNSGYVGGGVYAYGLAGAILVDSSTISGNSATLGAGAGILRAKYDLQIRNSTISGNSGGSVGGLILFGDLPDGPPQPNSEPGRGMPVRTVSIEFTTITGNSADEIGGLGISFDISIPITASVIAGNSAATDPDIAFNPGSQADLSFSLVGVDSTSGTLNFDAASSSLLGQDPLLGPLADNGGPTLAHLPGDASPLVDAIPSGSAGCGSAVVDDQRGQIRPQGDGCDLGSIERGVTAPPPAAVAVPVMDRISLLLMAGLLGLAGLFGFRRRSEQKS